MDVVEFVERMPLRYRKAVRASFALISQTQWDFLIAQNTTVLGASFTLLSSENLL